MIGVTFDFYAPEIITIVILTTLIIRAEIALPIVKYDTTSLLSSFIMA
jgi:hypothetical protein